MSSRARAIVAGATGYSGRELIRLLLGHPGMDLVGAFASPNAEAVPVDDIHPMLRGSTKLDCLPYDEGTIGKLGADLIFLATPNEFSHEAVPQLLASGAVVVDLSGAYRLKDHSCYPKYYGFEHTRPDLLSEAVFGLTEFCRGDLKGARLIANPGCYPTSILVPLVPLLEKGLIIPGQPIICDSKSGVTGAGKQPTSATHFVEVSESFKSYNLFRHRHTPEIAQGLGIPNTSKDLIFTPHLLPINRGILTTTYIRLNQGVGREDVHNVWRETFAGAPFVRIFDGSQLPEIKFVANTPFCDIGCSVDESAGMGIIVSTIDNLLKGASSQALQNANIALGYDESAGLR